MAINPFTLDPCKARAEIKSLHRRSKQITVEAKLDGGRYLLGNLEEYGVTLTSRRTSVRTKGKLDKIEHFPALKEIMENMSEKGWLVDGEITHHKGFKQVMSIMNSLPERALDEQITHGNLEYYVFDVLAAPGASDLFNVPLWKRRKFLQIFMREIYERHEDAHRYIAHIPVIGTVEQFDFPMFELEIADLFNNAVADGHEGLILKNLHGAYHQQEWAKVKASETWDMVIVGYEDSEAMSYAGLGIAALLLGLYDSEGVCRQVTKCSGMTDNWRRKFYEDKLAYMYKTVEIGGQLMFKNTGAIRHPRFIRLRPDVDEHEQTFEKYGVEE